MIFVGIMGKYFALLLSTSGNFEGAMYIIQYSNAYYRYPALMYKKLHPSNSQYSKILFRGLKTDRVTLASVLDYLCILSGVFQVEYLRTVSDFLPL